MKKFPFAFFLLLWTTVLVNINGNINVLAVEEKNPTVNGDQIIVVNKELSKNFVSGKRPDFSKNACSFAMRFRLFEKGESVKSGNGNNGMLFSVASGYYDGIRVWYSWDEQRICFEIGRVKEKSSIGIFQKGILPYLLYDLVCTYDGKKMSLYINGKLEAEAFYSGKLESKNAPIKVGYGGYGIGYNRMFVDQLVYSPRVLSQKEIADRMNTFSREDLAQHDLFKDFSPFFNYGAVYIGGDTRLFEKFQNFIEQDNKNSVFSLDYQFMLFQRFMYSKNNRKAIPLLLKEIKYLLDSETPDPNNEELANKRISRFFTVWEFLQTLNKNISGTSKYKELQNQLAEKFSSEIKLYGKIDLLKVKMLDRVHKMEHDALNEFQTVSQTANQGTPLLYLAPNGSDQGDGSRENPFGSLRFALEKALEKSRQGNHVVLSIMSGTYFCDQTVVLKDLQNAGSLLVKGDPEHPPVFTGKKILKNFQSVQGRSVEKRLAESARSKILVCDLKANGVSNFGQMVNRGYPVVDNMAPWTDLYIDGTAQTVARWPNENENPLNFGEVIPGPKAVLEGRTKRSDSRTFRYDFDRPDHWQLSDHPEENDIWATGLFQWEWAGCNRKVLNIDRKNHLITVDYQNISGRFHYYFRNILEELDCPGEFYIDRKEGLLYFYPPEEFDPEKSLVEFPVLCDPFVQLKNVEKVIFRDLIFTGTRGTAFLGEQCKNCYLDHCTIKEIGVHAVIMNKSQFSGVFHSTLEKLGGCGVRFEGGNRKKFEQAGLMVHDTRIATFCQVDRAYAAAVQTSGCGMIATNNLIYDSPHQAFRMDGSDQYCARNEVHSVVYEYSDQSGIDIYCDPMYRGIVIEKNFWHHIGSSLALCGQAGIRLDDSISGVVMKDNVFYRSSGGFFGGIQIHGGKDNLCIGNLFINCNKSFSFSPWATTRYLDQFIHGKYGTYVKEYLASGIYPFVDEDLEKNLNRNYIFHNESINGEIFQTNGTRWNIFVGNTWKKEKNELSADAPIPSPQDLRKKLEKISGRSLRAIGLIEGQEKIPHRVSPHYSEK